MGRRTENLLLDDLDELGLHGIRVDIRGGAGYTSGHDAGDILVGRPAEIQLPSGPYEYESKEGTDLYVIEEKYSAAESFKYIQEDGDKFDAMIEFAESIGATEFYEGARMGEADLKPYQSQRQAKRGDRLVLVQIPPSPFHVVLASLELVQWTRLTPTRSLRLLLRVPPSPFHFVRLWEYRRVHSATI